MAHSAGFLGHAGIIPICLAAFLLWLPAALIGDNLSLPMRGFALSFQNWVQYYCAIILSFLGAVHWGAGLSADIPRSGDAKASLAKESMPSLTYAVLPALLGWLALIPNNLIGGVFLSYAVRYGLLAVGFILALYVDLKSVRAGLFPAWYGALRLSITRWVLVFIALIIVSLIIEG